MHIQLAADAPVLLRLAAGTALALHIGGGTAGIASGAVAMVARKGSPLHRRAGDIFVGSMLALGGAAAVTAPLLPDRFSAVMGVFVCYLAITGWVSVRPASPLNRRLGMGAVALGAASGLGFAVLGAIASGHPHFVLDHEPGQVAFIATPLAAMAVAYDLRTGLGAALAGGARIARHLWRMGLALLVAEGSALGQPKVTALMPHGLAQWLLLGVLATFIALAWHLVRLRLRRPRRRGAAAVAA